MALTVKSSGGLSNLILKDMREKNAKVCNCPTSNRMFRQNWSINLGARLELPQTQTDRDTDAHIVKDKGRVKVDALKIEGKMGSTDPRHCWLYLCVVRSGHLILETSFFVKNNKYSGYCINVCRYNNN